MAPQVNLYWGLGMKILVRTILSAALVMGASARVLAEESENEWPCIQRQTGSLSAGILWPRPIEDVAALDPSTDALVAPLALRRVSIDEAEGIVRDYAAAHPDADPAQIDALFAAAFQRINRDRDRVLAGITRYARSQIALSHRIEATQEELARMDAEQSDDFDRFDALEEQLDWDQRIFRDRERSLTYVCETPVLLEKRAYAVAQILLPLLPQ